jgi:hypothetical protein
MVAHARPAVSKPTCAQAKHSQHARPRCGGLTCRSRRWRHHRRRWWSCARARTTHAPRQTQTPAALSNTRQREDRPADGSACTPAAPKLTWPLADNKASSLGHDAGDSRAARLVVPATADGGPTAPAHTDTHMPRQTQTPAAPSHGGDSVKDRPIDGSARTTAVPKPICAPAKTKVNMLGHVLGDALDARAVQVTTADGGVTAPAHAGTHTPRHTQTPAALSNTCGLKPPAAHARLQCPS